MPKILKYFLTIIPIILSIVLWYYYIQIIRLTPWSPESVGALGATVTLVHMLASTIALAITDWLEQRHSVKNITDEIDAEDMDAKHLKCEILNRRLSQVRMLNQSLMTKRFVLAFAHRAAIAGPLVVGAYLLVEAAFEGQSKDFLSHAWVRNGVLAMILFLTSGIRISYKPNAKKAIVDRALTHLQQLVITLEAHALQCLHNTMESIEDDIIELEKTLGTP